MNNKLGKHIFGPGLLNKNWGPGPVNTNWGPGPVNTNWGPGPVNTNWGPGAKQRVGGQEIQMPCSQKYSCIYGFLVANHLQIRICF